jgi:subtilase family serine protease
MGTYFEKKVSILVVFLLFVFILSGCVSATNHTNSFNSKGLVKGKDLLITSIVAPYESTKGKTIVVSNTVKNQGNKATGSFWVNFYLKKDDKSTLIYIGHRYIVVLGAGKSNTQKTKLYIPQSVKDGKYYIMGYADPSKVVAESNEKNNKKFSLKTINIKSNVNNSLSDLIISEIKHLDDQTLKYTVKNQGKTVSGPCKLYLSSGYYSFGFNYTPIYWWVDVPKLLPGKTFTGTWFCHSGFVNSYYGQIDYYNKVKESNENNNVLKNY